MATTTPNYGWDVPTSTDYVKDGATAIETLGDSVDSTLFTALGGAYPGLRLIKKQTIGSAVSSVTVTNAFSATYDNYKIIVTGGTATNDDLLQFRLGSTTTGYYAARYGFGWGFPQYTQGLSNQAIYPFIGEICANGLNGNVEVWQPFNAKQTIFQGLSSKPVTTGGFLLHSGFLNNTTSYTDFTVSAGSGTITGGAIYVYGYGAS